MRIFFAEEFEKVYFANLDSKFIGTYRSIANRQSAIKFCFSEDFSALEQVEVGILKLKETEQMRFMREFFACFVWLFWVKLALELSAIESAWGLQP